jgi:hypothetical protein
VTVESKSKLPRHPCFKDEQGHFIGRDAAESPFVAAAIHDYEASAIAKGPTVAGITSPSVYIGAVALRAFPDVANGTSTPDATAASDETSGKQ